MLIEMNKAKILLITILVLAVLYFGAIHTGLLGGNLGRISEIDTKFGVSESRLVPSEETALSEYKAELSAIETNSDSEKNIIGAKLALSEMQESVLKYSRESSRILAGNYECGPNSPIQQAKESASHAIGRAEKAISLIEQIPPSQRELFFGNNSEETIGAVISTMREQADVLGTVC
jgi:hypothetical protein